MTRTKFPSDWILISHWMLCNSNSQIQYSFQARISGQTQHWFWDDSSLQSYSAKNDWERGKIPPLPKGFWKKTYPRAWPSTDWQFRMPEGIFGGLGSDFFPDAWGDDGILTLLWISTYLKGFKGPIDWATLIGFTIRNLVAAHEEDPPSTKIYQKILVNAWVWSCFILLCSYAG